MSNNQHVYKITLKSGTIIIEGFRERDDDHALNCIDTIWGKRHLKDIKYIGFEDIDKIRKKYNLIKKFKDIQLIDVVCGLLLLGYFLHVITLIIK
jgi:hypothetical protein